MPDRTRGYRAFRRSFFVATALAGAASAWPAVAAAAPQSATTCHGWLSKAPTVDEANLLNYRFQCSWGITAYTVLANRQVNDYNTIDDFSTSPSAIDASGNVVANESLSCSSGSLPGNGVNCNAGGGYVLAPNWVEGSVDLTDPFCANAPPGSKPGTVPEPQAVVQLIVTDATGAQDGPFRLPLQSKCPAVKTPKPKPKASKRAKKHPVRRPGGV
jgi:hypothetical protein